MTTKHCFKKFLWFQYKHYSAWWSAVLFLTCRARTKINLVNGGNELFGQMTIFSERYYNRLDVSKLLTLILRKIYEMLKYPCSSYLRYWLIIIIWMESFITDSFITSHSTWASTLFTANSKNRSNFTSRESG